MTGAPASIGGALPAPLTGLELDRPRLQLRLDGVVEPGGPSDLAVVCSPAGFGKTTLVAAWVRRVAESGRPVAWCTLEPLRADRFRFWDSILHALSEADPGLRERLSAFHAPRGTRDVRFVRRLFQAVGDTPLVLVLDNLHELTEPTLVRELDEFMTSRPPGWAVVLAGRSDATLPSLPRLRFASRVVELRAADLAFTPEEVAAVCPQLTDVQQRQVWTRTEGWPALVRMTDLLFEGEGRDVDLAGHGGNLTDYLFQETFRRQPDDVQRALMLCSVPATLPLDLAVRLTGRPDAGDVLEGIGRRTGLVVRLRGGWATSYRFHPILRTYLHSELLRRDQPAEREAQRAAAEWFLASEARAEAVGHAVRSADEEFQERVLASTGVALVNAGESDLLLAALADAVRGGAALRLPWTRLVRALALLDIGRVDEANAQIELARDTSDEPEPVELRAIRVAAFIHLARRAGTALPPELLDDSAPVADPDLRILLAAERGPALVWTGALDRADEELVVGAELARGLGRNAALVDCLTFRAAVRAARADLRGMGPLLDEAFALAERWGWVNSHRLAFTHVLAGTACHQALDDTAARSHADLAAGLLDPAVDPNVVAAAHGLRAVLDFDTSDRVPAADAMHDVWRGLTGREATPALVASTALAHVRMSLALHRSSRAREVSIVLRERLGEGGELCLVEAMLADAAGHRERAREHVHEVAAGTVEAVSGLTRLDALCLQAAWALDDGDGYVAVASARTALELAVALAAARPLVESGSTFTGLLRSERGRWGVHENLVERVLEYSRPAVSTGVVLTPRELDVLLELPNLRTVEEIAAALFVSVNTVKTHMRSVYRKLGVATRRDAVSAARRSGLL